MRIVSMLLFVVILACVGCADMHAGRVIPNQYDEFDRTFRHTVVIGTVGGEFGSSLSVEGLELVRLDRDGEVFGYVLKGHVRSERIPLYVRTVQMKADDQVMAFEARSGRLIAGAGAYSTRINEPFEASIDPLSLKQLASAQRIDLRFQGDGVHTNAYRLTEKQRDAVRTFFNSFVYPKP